MTLNISRLPDVEVKVVGTEVVVYLSDDEHRTVAFTADSFDAIKEWADAIHDQVDELDPRRIDAGPDDIEF